MAEVVVTMAGEECQARATRQRLTMTREVESAPSFSSRAGDQIRTGPDHGECLSPAMHPEICQLLQGHSQKVR